ncbi:molybdopterin-dependent oxidoreductase [Chitinimonas sp. BJYL2]|uniref:molybdopterin-dependent oxidoreductase n=1 Tax=Chitinimonas sp. BJYL2 TaxID=2976696 RepID=UPI0022B5408B|nr:molybdopterin-dependent oxidoreductase [Chitinimonas sp. BJYL2]
MSSYWRHRLAIILLFAASLGVQALDKPTGRVMLTITGGVSQANAGKDAQFDLKMLEALPQHSFTTKTPWYPEPMKFTGPLLRDVLARAGAKGSKIIAVALNDYKAELPFADAAEHEVIVALKRNDRLMSIRDKGPLFLIYPFDNKPALRTEVYYGRATWQLKALQIK